MSDNSVIGLESGVFGSKAELSDAQQSKGRLGEHVALSQDGGGGLNFQGETSVVSAFVSHIDVLDLAAGCREVVLVGKQGRTRVLQAG